MKTVDMIRAVQKKPGMEMGRQWGGNWKTIVDQPHFQLRPAWATGMPERSMLAELRRRTKLGEDIA